MRVTLVVGANQIGGAERQVQRLTDAFRDAGVDAALLFLERPGRRTPGARAVPEAGWPQHLWLGRGTRWLGPSLWRRHLRRHRPEVVHAYNVDAAEFVAANTPAEVTTLLSVRGLLFERDPSVAARLRGLARGMDAVTTNCRAIRDALLAEGVAEQTRVHVLPNLVPRCAKPASGGAEMVLFVGSLKAVKDPLGFLEACAELAVRRPKTRVVVVGDGPLRPGLETGVVARALGEHVRFRGHLPSVAIPYDEASIVVSNSRSEGASNTLLEALSCGVPVVATAVGGSVEIVEESGAGALVPPGNPKALADTMEALLKDPSRRQEMASLGREFIDRRHSASSVVDAHLQLYRAFCGERSKEDSK